MLKFKYINKLYIFHHKNRIVNILTQIFNNKVNYIHSGK